MFTVWPSMVAKFNRVKQPKIWQELYTSRLGVNPTPPTLDGKIGARSKLRNISLTCQTANLSHAPVQMLLRNCPSQCSSTQYHRLFLCYLPWRHCRILRCEFSICISILSTKNAGVSTTWILHPDRHALRWNVDSTQSVFYKRSSVMMTLSPRWDSESFLCIRYALCATWHQLMVQDRRRDVFFLLSFFFTVHLQIDCIFFVDAACSFSPWANR